MQMSDVCLLVSARSDLILVTVELCMVFLCNGGHNLLKDKHLTFEILKVAF